MKLILIFCMILLSTGLKSQKMGNFYPQEVIDSLNKLKVGTNNKPTRYKAGFTYYDERGVKNTLLKWEYIGNYPTGINTHRWRVRSEWLDVSVLTWTDDTWIDVYTHKAYINECTHQIVYCDSSILGK